MGIAEQIAKKYGLPTEDTPMVENEEHQSVPKWPHVVQKKSVLPAIREAFELAAQEAEKSGHYEVAARIRRMGE